MHRQFLEHVLSSGQCRPSKWSLLREGEVWVGVAPASEP